jgi:hypothetical protein
MTKAEVTGLCAMLEKSRAEAELHSECVIGSEKEKQRGIAFGLSKAKQLILEGAQQV